MARRAETEPAAAGSPCAPGPARDRGCVPAPAEGGSAQGPSGVGSSVREGVWVLPRAEAQRGAVGPRRQGQRAGEKRRGPRVRAPRAERWCGGPGIRAPRAGGRGAYGGPGIGRREQGRECGGPRIGRRGRAARASRERPAQRLGDGPLKRTRRRHPLRLTWLLALGPGYRFNAKRKRAFHPSPHACLSADIFVAFLAKSVEAWKR